MGTQMKLNSLTAIVLGGASGGLALWLGGEALAVLVRRIVGPSFGSDFLTWLVLQRVALGAWVGSSFAALTFRQRDDSTARLVFWVFCSVAANVWLTIPIFAALAERIFGR